MPRQHRSRPHPVQQVDDAELLDRLGVERVLHRRMSGSANALSTFDVMSITSGSLVMFGFGLHTGGPAVMVWGWIVVSALVLLVAASLSEVTSAYPTSGALYDMANRLGGRGWGYATGRAVSKSGLPCDRAGQAMPSRSSGLVKGL